MGRLDGRTKGITLRIDACSRPREIRPRYGRAGSVPEAEKKRDFGTKDVVDPYAGRIDGAGERKWSDELGEIRTGSRSVVQAVLNGKSIENRTHGRNSLLSEELVRNILHSRSSGLGQTKPFIRREEEAALSSVIEMRDPDGSTERGSEVILPQGGRRLAEVIVEPIIRIEEIISEIVEGAPMKAVGAGAGHERELTAGRSSILGRIAGALNAKLLQCIDGDQGLRRA